MRCPISNCKRVQEAEQRHIELCEKYVALEREYEKLKQVPELFSDIFRFFQEGCQVLGVEEKNGTFYAVVMDPCSPDPRGLTVSDDRHIYLYQLPCRTTPASLGYIGVDLRECCSVYIDDVEIYSINQGHGSMLLKNVINFFHGAGFRMLSGEISSVDSDHFDRLRHFYEKFGFEVAVRGTRGSIHLDLQNVKTPAIESNGEIVCCRGSGYSKLRSEQLLAAAREKANIEEPLAKSPKIC